MIHFNDWTISIHGDLARQYDNLTRRIEVEGDIPKGWNWAAMVQVGKNFDIIALDETETGLGVDLTREQLAFDGYYNIQLRGTQGGKVRHTNIIQTYVGESMSGDGNWPTVPSEFSQFEQRLTELATHPPVPGTDGFWQIWNPANDRYETSAFPLPDIVEESKYVVRFVDQELTEGQQEQARNNIAAVSLQETSALINNAFEKERLNGAWASPIVSDATGSIVEIKNPSESFIRRVVATEGATVDRITTWGKNHFHNKKGASVTNIGVTVTWDAENQEFVFNGITTAPGDLKLVAPMELDWINGQKYTLTATKVSGKATLAAGSGGTTYAWGIFQDNAAKFIRGATGLASFVDAYIFTGTAFEPPTGRSLIFYFQCWRPGTVFEDYRVKIQIEKGENSTEWEAYRAESVPVAEATSLLLRKGYNYIKAVPMAEISVSYVSDTKTYVDSKAGSGGTVAKVEGNTLIL